MHQNLFNGRDPPTKGAYSAPQTPYLELGGEEPLGRGWVWNGEAQRMEGNAVKGRGECKFHTGTSFFPLQACRPLVMVSALCSLQCCDADGSVAGRTSGP